MSAEKPKRLQHKTYLGMITNSVGTEMFRNWYVETPEQGEFDAMQDGENSSAFFVSGLLKMLDKLAAIHGTVDSTVRDLQESGWQTVGQSMPGDVLIWEAQRFGDRDQRHIGFYVGDGRAVSTSWTEKKVVVHDYKFDAQNRQIMEIYRMDEWDDS
jgi:hypothetical protein